MKFEFAHVPYRAGMWVLAPILAGSLLQAVALSGEEAAAGSGSSEGAVLTSDEADALLAEIGPKVEQLRALEFKSPVKVSVVDDDQAREFMIGRLQRFQPEEDLKLESRALALLGIIPEGLDVLEAYLSFLREQVGGFYDPATKQFFLLEDMPRVVAPVLVSHELTHALEDQHYDLDGRLEEALPDDDLVFAQGAVHEGSATLLMTLYLAMAMAEGRLTQADLAEIAGTEAARGELLQEFPAPLLRPLLGAYLLGVGFLVGGDMMGVMSQGFPASRVDRAYKDWPKSSEQIIHPEKYWEADSRDEPTAVSLGASGRLLGRRWKKRADGVLGELMIGSMVGAPTPRDASDLSAMNGQAWTNAAAAGWDGDRWELWTRGGSAVVLLGTVWDSPEDAAEFAEALEEHQALTWKRRDRRVVVIAGDAAREKREEVLSAMMSEVAVPAD